jgi:hypothetical protein
MRKPLAHEGYQRREMNDYHEKIVVFMVIRARMDKNQSASDIEEAIKSDVFFSRPALGFSH